MSPQPRRTVLVTGATGYIGRAVCRSFVRSGWHVLALTRQPSSLPSLLAEEITPILGTPDDPSFIAAHAASFTNLDTIVSTTEAIDDYVPHYEAVVAMLRRIAALAAQKPLVLFTSGCKDYGTTTLDGEPTLKPHTEGDALKPPAFAEGRAYNAVRIFDNSDAFDPALLRPTSVYGHDSSFYGALFELAAGVAEKQREGATERWVMASDPRTCMHAMHVDDCGDAYVALAEADRASVTGEVFNISAGRYETLGEVVEALMGEYEIKGPIEYTGALGQSEKALGIAFLQAVIGFSQWVSSDKIRRVTGWNDKRPLFSESIGTYRRAYDAWKELDGSKQSRAAMLRDVVRRDVLGS